ncbi:hypothetical protein MATL_G00198270 [Megalops atlanticus]|uniref:SRCR domain-containing protein n=1 Tax=Megalops atlanticus TaxID=7932 RepID=A0A9D3PJR1_MEGAT|nr:hypothetical protein MATL_G00198270 [Megalops atlanticus]
MHTDGIKMMKLVIMTLALLLFSTDVSAVEVLSTPISPHLTLPTSPSCTPCPPPVTCPTPPPPAPPALPLLGVLSVTEDRSTCMGVVYLELGHSKRPLCRDSAIPSITLTKLCTQIGCGALKTRETQRAGQAFNVHGDGSVENSTCPHLRIQCKGRSDSRELRGHKVAVGLLCVLLIILLLVKVGPRMYSTISARLTGRRGREWIGPTQSQSVSFHRAQAGLNSNTGKRTSYPGLERLAVNSSRQPSSNRNSDCDSYN